MNKKLIKRLTITGSILVVLTTTLLVVGFNSFWYQIPEQEKKIENNTSLVQAKNRALYDKDGNYLQLRGINAGNILIQEGWMSPFSLEPEKNKDGSYVTDKDGNYQYPEFTEEQFREGLKSNPNLKNHDLEAMMDYYYACYFEEQDFAYIKNELKMNVIRLPFYYRNILNDDLSLKDEVEAFSYLDWFITGAKNAGLYVILDLHGCPGSQNGLLHSGDNTKGSSFWFNEDYVNSVINLWDFVSHHYTVTRPDLGPTIATYDLINEPTETANGRTTKMIHKVYDRLYKTIRENNDEHVLTIEGCWGYNTLPNPKDYNWENVQYSYHFYNWNPNLDYGLYYFYKDLGNLFRNYNVPVLLGEFTCFEDTDAWKLTLDDFDRRYYSWTIWSYKVASQGWWDSSWGIQVSKLNHNQENAKMKTNVSTCTYQEFIATCELMKTDNCETGYLKGMIDDYNKRRGY